MNCWCYSAGLTELSIFLEANTIFCVLLSAVQSELIEAFLYVVQLMHESLDLTRGHHFFSPQCSRTQKGHLCQGCRRTGALGSFTLHWISKQANWFLSLFHTLHESFIVLAAFTFSLFIRLQSIIFMYFFCFISFFGHNSLLAFLLVHLLHVVFRSSTSKIVHMLRCSYFWVVLSY